MFVEWISECTVFIPRLQKQTSQLPPSRSFIQNRTILEHVIVELVVTTMHRPVTRPKATAPSHPGASYRSFPSFIHGFPDSSAGKESAYSEGDLGLISGLGRSPGEGNSYPFQYSGLENFMGCPWGHRGFRHDWATFTFTFLHSFQKVFIDTLLFAKHLHGKTDNKNVSK